MTPSSANETELAKRVAALEEYIRQQKAAGATEALPAPKADKDKKEDKDVRIGAIVGLGNIQNKRAVQALIDVLKDKKEDQRLQIGAISSLGSIGDESAIGAIQDAASRDSTGRIKHAAEIALRKIAEGR